MKIRLGDNTEIAAKLVLQDPDLDLAFVMPDDENEKDRKYDFVDLKKAATVGTLDRLVLLGRLSKSLNREATVGLGRVTAVVSKPRTFYAYSADAGNFGIPVFDLDGKVIGLSLMRKAPGGGGGGGIMSIARQMSPVVLPAEDVLEIAGQALEKK